MTKKKLENRHILSTEHSHDLVTKNDINIQHEEYGQYEQHSPHNSNDFLNTQALEVLGISIINSQEEEPLTLKDLAKKLKSIFHKEFPPLWIQGEISSYVCHGSGHRYFSLKEDNHLLDAVSWKNVVLHPTPVVGETLACYGTLAPYDSRSKYQFVVQKVRAIGQGSLMAQIEERKEKLRLEGLFDEKHKKALPKFPEHIAILTSPGGAVIHDMLAQWTQRFPARLTLYPVNVQGDCCVKNIIEGLNYFQALPCNDSQKPQVIIVARGGGSFEDLLPFQDESLVRAIFQCSIPVVSAIGHESDYTLVDHVSSLRAPTPTAAIASLLPLKNHSLDYIHGFFSSIVSLFQREISLQKSRYTKLLEDFNSCGDFLEYLGQLCDDLWEKLLFAMEQWFFHKERPIRTLESLFHVSKKDNLQLYEEQLKKAEDKIILLFQQKISQWNQNILHFSHVLYLLSHQHTLDRGFFLISQKGVFLKNLDTITGIFTLHSAKDTIDVRRVED